MVFKYVSGITCNYSIIVGGYLHTTVLSSSMAGDKKQAGKRSVRISAGRIEKN
jgi:hypothetical protein